MAWDTRRSNWIEIQRVTFTNWINEELNPKRQVEDEELEPKHQVEAPRVKDIQTDFRDGLVSVTCRTEKAAH